ncbi:hypothetical protein [Microbacterium sp. SORGH_AS_0862]|uniref:hypothetical protein n=1 Tax=Microbacterium sp. SORGH_AS_0862 TaxID=3041789 RepID=UPI00279168DC|nr:hypothetical protein [Microbacterium sp. SORGH_AS_0862]MDQ1205652.1 O-antigen/teichoic acid export membrane protein [Microbacterium sp. SORGH_AS_0862]
MTEPAHRPQAQSTPPAVGTPGVRGVLARNGLANVLRSASTSGLTIALPLALVLLLDNTLYAVWALVFSIGAYLAYLDAGVPTTMQAITARAVAMGDTGAVRRVARSGLIVSTTVVMLFLAFASVFAVFLGTFVPAIPGPLAAEGALTLVLITIGQGATLLANAAAAHFAGLQRNFIPTWVLAPARLLAFGLAVAAAAVTKDLAWTAAGYALPLLAGTVIMVCLVNRSASRLTAAGIGTVDDEMTRLSRVFGVLGYSGPLIIWSVCSLAASGFSTLIVARFAYQDLVGYSLATVVLAALTGVMSALSGPLLPQFAGTHAIRREDVGRQIVLATRMHSALLCTLAAGALAVLPWYLGVVADGNASEAPQVWAVGILLVAAGTAQLLSNPLALGFIATRTHSRLIFPPVVSAGASLLLSLILVVPLGGVGVALGVFLGSLLGTTLTCFWSVRVSRIAGLRPGDAFRWTLGVPAPALIPIVAAVAALSASGAARTVWGAVVAVIAAAGAVAWQMAVVVPKSERAVVTALARRLTGR